MQDTFKYIVGLSLVDAAMTAEKFGALVREGADGNPEYTYAEYDHETMRVTRAAWGRFPTAPNHELVCLDEIAEQAYVSCAELLWPVDVLEWE